LRKPVNEPQPKPAKYVLLEVGDKHFAAIPLDVFIEMDGEIPVLKMNLDKELKLITTPTAFTLITEAQMEVIRAKAE
jgi:hypothetical protein